MAKSDGILVGDDVEDIPRVYCKACNVTVNTPGLKELCSHVDGPQHKGIVKEYNQILVENEETAHSFDVARFKYENKHLYEYISNNNIKDVEVRININTVQGRTEVKCDYFCLICEKNIFPRIDNLEQHLSTKLHKKDSKGYTAEEFNLETCKLFLISKYIMSI